MTARMLNKALQDMYDNKKFAKLVFYLESCYRGSIFEDLSKALNIYALTASDPSHSAFMNYCDDPLFKGVCLDGQFSTSWTESAEIADFNTYTFRQHVEAIKTAVSGSHPQQYGGTCYCNTSSAAVRIEQNRCAQSRPARNTPSMSMLVVSPSTPWS